MVAGAVDRGPADLPGFGPYRIQELLGQGGMGVVHRAYDTVHQRVVALKRLPASVTDREYRQRFQREARIAAGLRHPNVIPVHDFGEIDGDLFLDMMLVDGADLRRELGDGALGQERAIHVLSQVAAALDAAHAGGLIHRDVKPSNILIAADGHAYLADFGIARETSPEATVLTRSGDLIGTWDYMAPERMSSGQIDSRADQYSLACVLFECLTGRLAHPATDPAAKVAAHLLQPPPAPSVFDPTITPALDAVVMRGMAKDPGRRFPSATAMMLAAREAAFSGETLRAARPTAAGPGNERDQGKLVRAIMRASGPRKRPTLALPHGRPPTCPYPGLIGFERTDADLFHGRAHVVTDLLVRLAEQLDGGEPVVLVGASGAGKSSVLHAGLLPALASADANWPQIVLTPGADPVGLLATGLAPHVNTAPAEIARLIRETPHEFGSLCARSPGRAVIVVDQFEELFTHGVADTDRLAFATALSHARPGLVVLAVRADLVDRCIELAPLMPALTSPVLLGPMDATELREAIVSPARDFGVDIEPGLPERLIADLGVRGEFGYDPGALPRLAHALRESWNYREGHVLTLAAYRRAGGIDGAVSRTAEEIHNRLDPVGRQALRAILLRLVTVFEEGGVARRRVDPGELAVIDRPDILDSLISARLVTVDATGARISHEALLTAWPRLRDWIDEDRAGLLQYRRFADAVRVWADSGQQDDDLYRGARLSTVNTWLESARDRVRLQPAEQEFLARSNAAEQAGVLVSRRRTRRLRALVVALSALLVVAGGAVVVATGLRQDAQDATGRADAARQLNLSRQLAAESTLARVIDPRRGELAALGAWQAGLTVEGRSALLTSATDAYQGLMTGHKGAISSVALSGDGKIAVSGGTDGTLRMWDVPNRRQLAVLDDKGGWYRKVVMSDDGKLMATAALGPGQVTLWSVPDRKRLFTVPDKAVDTAITPDGKSFVAIGDRGVVVWDTATHAERISFDVGKSIASAFSPDGTMVATTNENTVHVNRVSDGALLTTLTAHTSGVTAVAFDRTNGVLATGSMDATVRLWNTRDWSSRQVLNVYEGGISTIVISPLGTSVVAAGIGTTINAWNLTSGELTAQFTTRNVTTFGMAISGDGHTLLSANSDGELTRWRFERTVLGLREGSVGGVAYQPNGKLIATIWGDGSARLYDRETGDMVRQLPGTPSGAGTDITFSPDGKQVAGTAGKGNGSLVLWDAATGAELHRFDRPGTELAGVVYSPDGRTLAVSGRSPTSSQEDHDEVLLLQSDDLTMKGRRATRAEPHNEQQNPVDSNSATGISFSPDGRTLAISLTGGKIALWNLVDPGSELTLLAGHPQLALDVEFSPDGTLLASGGADRLIRMWRVRDGQQVGEFTGNDAAVRRVVFSPDGKVLATASQDTVLRLWDVRDGQLLARLDRHGDSLNDVAFDPSGERVASASADGSIRLWDIVPERAVQQLCGVLDRDRLADEWRMLGPDRGDAPKCQ
jgi:WD40 repeat protein